MKINTVTVNHFGSYGTLTFNFNDLGLILIHGETGSGKSTIMDMPVWAIYGRTGKDGNVDEIRSWTSPDSPTSAVIDVETSTGTILITRVRGRQSENDLYYQEELESGLSEPIRGKDLTETQKLINQRLGVSYEELASGSLFNEFSPVGSFFTSKSKDRRELFESIADLSLPTTVLSATKDELKETKKSVQKAIITLASATSALHATHKALSQALNSSELWTSNQTRRIQEVEERAASFESAKLKKINQLRTTVINSETEKCEMLHNLSKDIETLQTHLKGLNGTCSHCNQPVKEYHELNLQLKMLERKRETESNKVNPFADQLQSAMDQLNPFLDQVQREKQSTNPFAPQLGSLEADLNKHELEIKAFTGAKLALEHSIILLEQLQDLSSQLRVELLRKAVSQVETSTNQYLETHFDAALRVKFELTDGETLDVSIQKDGHECVYKQLSKGQRQLLRLTFALSVMAISSNKASTHFNCLMFDEVLDALDTKLKTRAYSLFEELSLQHESIILIDHSEDLKNMFESKILVEMVGDVSRIAESELQNLSKRTELN